MFPSSQPHMATGVSSQEYPVALRFQAARLSSSSCKKDNVTTADSVTVLVLLEQCGRQGDHCRLCYCILISSRQRALTSYSSTRGCLPLSHVGSQNKMVLAVYFSTRPVHQQTEQSLLKLLMIYFTLHSPCSIVILTSGGLCSMQIQIEIRRCMGWAALIVILIIPGEQSLV